VVVHFVDIGEIVYHRGLNFLFTIKSIYKHKRLRKFDLLLPKHISVILV